MKRFDTLLSMTSLALCVLLCVSAQGQVGGGAERGFRGDGLRGGERGGGGPSPATGLRYTAPEFSDALIDRVLEIKTQVNAELGERLRDLRIANPAEFQRYLSREFSKRVGMILYLQRSDPEAAELYIDEERLGYDVREAMSNLRLISDEAMREEFKKEIRQLVGDHFDAQLLVSELSYVSYEKSLVKLRKGIGERDGQREKLIAERRAWLIANIKPSDDAFAKIHHGPRPGPGGPGGSGGPGGGGGPGPGGPGGIGRGLIPGGAGGPSGSGRGPRGPRGGAEGEGRGPGGPGGPSGDGLRGGGPRGDGERRGSSSEGRESRRKRFKEMRIENGMETLRAIHPRMAEAMDVLKVSDPDDFESKIMGMVDGLLGRLLDAKRFDPAGYELHVTEQRLSNETYDMVRLVNAKAAGDPTLPGLNAQLDELLVTHFDARQLMRSHAITQLEKQIAELGEDIERRKEERSKIIGERYRNLVNRR